ncbi:CCDC90 family protein [Methylomonas rapida]|uniref:CCDC90 family protein n=1 Tax=Methylomonas rapida TaxID=2963939 RepID=A0ABY7GLN0_9GAMM|nr:CCDC90 family protein [Methylomonas rapida]WAR45397.1 CCDC90 family protein [Methylomonas rapida]
MNAIPFDTLKFANWLKAVGFTETQTETIVEIQREANNETLHHAIHDFHLDDIATKRDIKELERDIKAMEVALKRDLADVEMRLRRTAQSGALDITDRPNSPLLRKAGFPAG